MTRGFITVATGKDKYYKIAVNMLRSYRLFADEKYRFAILADRENEYTKEFDDVIILKNPHFSYLDKVEVLNNIPYDETVFIESDCLAYYNLNLYFDMFKNADDFSVFGRALPLDTKEECWFKLEETGKYKEQIHFLPRFHSAVLFLRKGEKCQKMYDVCMDIYNNFDSYNIGGSREALDDKLFAVSSAVNNLRMSGDTLENHKAFCYYPYDKNDGLSPKPCMYKKQITVKNIGGGYGLSPYMPLGEL